MQNEKWKMQNESIGSLDHRGEDAATLTRCIAIQQCLHFAFCILN
jgi:hypothetical protein